MAQFFYDLSVANPNGGLWPAVMKGSKGSENHASIAYIGPAISGVNTRGFLVEKARGQTAHSSIAAGVSSVDTEVLYKVSGSRGSDSTFNNIGPAAVFLRASGFAETGRPENCYYVANGNSAGISSQYDLTLCKVVAGSQTVLSSASSVITSSIDHRDLFLFIRLQALGNTVRARMWREGAAEPTSWQVSVTDTSITGAGDAGFIAHGFGGKFVAQFLSIGTEGDAAPLTYPGGGRSIAGIVKQPNGDAAVGYKVRCHHRDSGVLLAETTSVALGAFNFSLNIPSTEKVYCLAIDQVGNSWNAPIKDMIEPSNSSDVNYALAGANPLPLAWDGTQFIFAVMVNKLSTGESYRAVATAVPASTGFTLNRATRLASQIDDYSSSSCVVNGEYVTFARINQFLRAPLASLSTATLSDFELRTYNSFPVADFGGSPEFVKLKTDGSNVFTVDNGGFGTWYGVVFESTDSLNFSEPSTISGLGLRSTVAHYFNGYYFCAGRMYARAAGRVELMRSADLVTFTSYNFASNIATPAGVNEGESFGTTFDVNDIGGKLVALISVDTGPDSGLHVLTSSDDGSTWVDVTPSGWSSADGWRSIVKYDGSLVFLGKGKTAKTSDGTTFVTTSHSDPDAVLSHGVAGGTKLVCRSVKQIETPEGPTQEIRALISSDGISFTQLTSA